MEDQGRFKITMYRNKRSARKLRHTATLTEARRTADRMAKTFELMFESAEWQNANPQQYYRPESAVIFERPFVDRRGNGGFFRIEGK
ncbi:hypothetical protein LCGC14_1528430 [marine sediment metagenome]|uniref:Uncharacterized protein n=1 Tax=marine sediment metagenome TaxID=412755 RepID=A0A0F9LXJ3_9ZZZZ